MRTTKWSRRLYWLGICGAICLPFSAHAAELSIKSDTLFRAFQRDTRTEKDAAVTPLYEYLQVDYGASDKPGLAFHLYGWGRWDIANNGYYNDSTDGELLYGYMEYSRNQAHFNARIGRQQVFEGISNEAIDGLRLGSDLGRYFSWTAYGGQPVSFNEEEGSSGDSILGGRLAQHLTGLYEVGVSYKKIRNDSSDAGEKAGVDLSAYLPYGVNLYGYSTYNLDTDNWGETSYEMHFAYGPVTLRPYFQKFRYEDYFGTGDKTTNNSNSVNPFRFLANTGEVLKIGGGDLIWTVNNSWSLTFKAKHYDYKVLEGTSQFYSAQATWSGKGQSQIGSELGSMNGEADENKYYLVRVYSYWDQLPKNGLVAFLSGDLVYVNYDKEIYGEDSSLFISLGAGRKFLEDALELKLSGDYSSDPYFDGDLRGMFTVSYHFGKKL